MSRSTPEKTTRTPPPLSDRFGPEVRLAAGLLALFTGLYLALWGKPWLALSLVIVALALFWHYLRSNGVWLAFRQFKRGNLGQVRRLLAGVRWPHLLSRECGAYYHWLRGVVDTADGRYQAAKVHLLVAAAGRLRTENDRTLVHCLLSEVALLGGDPVEAQQHLDLARSLRHTAAAERMLAGLEARLRMPPPEAG